MAATVALWVMIDFTLNEARVKRYGNAAHHLTTCADPAGRIDVFVPFEPHDVYVARLRWTQGKETGFWLQVGG